MLSFLRDTLAIVQSLDLMEDQIKALQDIIAAIHAYVDGHVNENIEQRNLEDFGSKRESHLTIFS